MKIIWISLQYPIGSYRQKGVFIERTANELAKIYDLEVIVPYNVSFPVISILTNPKRCVETIRGYFGHHPDTSDRSISNVSYIPYIRLSRSRFRYIEGWLIFIAVILQRKFHPNSCLFHAQWLTPEGHAALLLAKYSGNRFAVTMRGTDVNSCKGNRCMAELSSKIVNFADGIAGNSHYIYEEAIRNEIKGIPPLRNVLHNMYDVSKFKIKDRRASREVLHISLQSRVIFAAGALRKVKNFDSLIKCLIYVDNAPLLIIAGEGPEFDRLHDLSKQYQVSSKVLFVGNLSHEVMVDYYNASDVFCLVSHKEGFGNVVIESLLCGTPVVATNTGELPIYVKDGSNGYLCDPCSIHSIADALNKSFAAHGNRDRIRESVSSLDPENVKKEYWNFYNSIGVIDDGN